MHNFFSDLKEAFKKKKRFFSFSNLITELSNLFLFLGEALEISELSNWLSSMGRFMEQVEITLICHKMILW